MLGTGEQTMELNAEQIKNALEHCKSPKLTKCDGCPREKEDGHCMYRLNEDALSLIKSQEQEIFELENRLKECENGYEGTLHLDRCKLHDAEQKIKELTKGVERVTKQCGEIIVECDERDAERLMQVAKLTEENDRLSKEVADLKDELKCEKETNAHLCGQYMSENNLRHQAEEMLANAMSVVKADTVRKMQSEIKERCIKGGIYPAFVASTIDQIAKEMLEGE